MWEYKIVQQSASKLDTEEAGLNELGKENWELVEVILIEDWLYYYLKRPKPPSPSYPPTETPEQAQNI